MAAVDVLIKFTNHGHFTEYLLQQVSTSQRVGALEGLLAEQLPSFSMGVSQYFTTEQSRIDGSKLSLLQKLSELPEAQNCDTLSLICVRGERESMRQYLCVESCAYSPYYLCSSWRPRA